MKILILSCNTGEGHNSCARAISEELERKGDWGYIADGLAFLSTGTSKFVSGWHTRLYRYFPRLYGKGYEYAEKHPMNIKKHTAAYRMIRRGARRLRKVIKAGGYGLRKGGSANNNAPSGSYGRIPGRGHTC